MSTPLTSEMRGAFERFRDYMTGSDFIDREFWIGVCDRALGRDPAYDALGHILRPRRYRYCEGHGAQKALVAKTPAGCSLPARNYDHAQCLRSAAKKLGRRVKVRQAAPNKPERLVTFLT